jgi:hypothetical protein
MTQENITIPTIEGISKMLIPVINSINEISSKIDKIKPPREFYRNKDLKELFGLSDNTIIKYRDQNIIPSTKIGDLFYYPVDGINAILKQNSNHHTYYLQNKNSIAA